MKINDEIYKGCGKAWVAVKDGEIVAIRYMNACPIEYREVPDARFKTGVRKVDITNFGVYRTACRDELATFGEVWSGIASCCYFTFLR